MEVARDLLDKAVRDRNGREMGRVDGVIFEDGERPLRLHAILIGPVALAHRLHPALGRWVAALEEALGLPRERPVEISIRHVIAIEPHVKVDLAISDTAVDAVEQRLRRWLWKLPSWL
jgi:sporulation protein YlmC with PRC-barrel domain